MNAYSQFLAWLVLLEYIRQLRYPDGTGSDPRSALQLWYIARRD